MAFLDDYGGVIDAFGLDPRAFQPESIYAFGAVFRGVHDRQEIVVKRTRSPMRIAEALLRWSTCLAESGVDVVTSESRIVPNPVHVGDDVWVAYPFVSGRPYASSELDVRSAGSLLGLIHASSCDPSDESFPRFAFPDIESGYADDDLHALEEVLQRNDVHDATKIMKRYETELGVRLRDYRDALASSELDWVVGPWDYKANNLVYRSNERPVLIDPDSAGRLPRILDLALAAVLFHNEHHPAPGRLFTTTEWKWFYAGYSEHVELTPTELQLWSTALEYMRLEEGVWLMLNDAVGWRGGRQREFLLDLVTNDLHQLAI